VSTFAGKVALVTGGTRGLGLAAAHAFVRRGARVVITARSHDQGLQAVEDLRRAGGEGRPASSLVILLIPLLLRRSSTQPSRPSVALTSPTTTRGSTAASRRSRIWISRSLNTSLIRTCAPSFSA